MDKIIIKDLEVDAKIGVTEAERAQPQRLLVTVEMERDFSGVGDELARTIDYHAVCRRIREFGKGRSWKLIESLCVDLAEMILREYKPASTTVEVRKFILPETRHISVRVTRPARR